MKYCRNILVTATITVFIGLLIFPVSAFAHVSEQGFILLLPTKLYIISGTAAVAITMLVIALFPASFVGRFFASRNFGNPIKLRFEVFTSLLGTTALLAIVAIGFTGPRDPLENLLPLLIWTVWWQGLLVLQALFGNIWNWINPWSGLYHLITARSDGAGYFKLPNRLGYLPAILTLTCFGLYALVDLAPDDPARLAAIVLGYWVYTMIGMLLFGKRDWFERAECFTIIFRLFAYLAPIALLKGQPQIGIPGWQLEKYKRHQVSAAVLMIMILALGSFDGLNETFWWLGNIGINPLEFPGRSAVMWPNTIGLLASLLLLPILFYLCIHAGLKLANSTSQLSIAFASFAVCILPIAVVYHFSHYLTSFLVNIQYALAALSDPFDNGSDHLGLGMHFVTSGFLKSPTSVKFIWLVQAGSVVAGHVISVLLAHSIALKLTSSTRQATLLQIPLALFMLAYTIFGLWLLASPRGI